MNISVVIPLFNEEESLNELCEWIVRVMDENGYSFEIILIDDGSKDSSWEIIERLGKENKHINFIGNIEGRDVLFDKADVVVCEGFTGNVVLKRRSTVGRVEAACRIGGER